MKAAILTIGDEILMGQITDTNSIYIARLLSESGIETCRMQSVPDQGDAIRQALDNLLSEADLLFITGGLGPTKDDITKKVLCDYFDDELVFDDQTYRHIESLLAHRQAPMNRLNRDQALLPRKAEILPNRKGTAAGMWFSQNGKQAISLPGVPFEMECLMDEEVMPRLHQRFPQIAMAYRMFIVYNVAESALAEKLEAFENQLPEKMGLAYLPSPGYVKLRLTAKAAALPALETQAGRLEGRLQSNRYQYIIPGGPQSDNLAAHIGSLLRRQGRSLSTAESCTGGYLAHLITAVPGSSDYYKGSVIAYSNEIKESILDVQSDTLRQQGAVSEETVIEMAQSVRRKFGTDYAISTSGIAGPGGGTPQKPVGTVWIAVATPRTCLTKLCRFSSDRERNIERASIQALGLLLTALTTEAEANNNN